MSRRGKSGPKGLCAYLVEIQEQDGEYTVPKDYSYLVSKCIEDKIFSENTDEVAICRSDTTSNLSFIPADWDGLRTALKVLNETRSSDDDSGSIENPVTCINMIIKAMDAQMKNDTYEQKKIVFFASLSSYILDRDEVTKLADKLVQKDVFLSMVLPNKEDMSDIQRENLKVLKKVFNQDKYADVSCVMNLRRAQSQIINTQTKKATRPSPWNVPFEISSKILFNVSGFVCTRANVLKDMKQVFVKQGWMDEREAGESQFPTSHSNGGSSSGYSTQGTSSNNDRADEPEVEEAKKVIEKEKYWTSKDGERVDEDNIEKAYYFADKLVQYNDDDSYQTGEKCMKLLAFCPLENINFAFLTGNGTTIFYPRKDDMQAEVCFKALLKSMINLQRVAIVRKVYRKGTKCVLGLLYPDNNRGCLVLIEMNYADDISIPQFPILTKPEETVDEDCGEAIVSEQEELIDKLIAAKSLDSFSPFDGPADPAVAALREKIASKILKRSEEDVKGKPLDNIDIYFQNLMLDSTLVNQLRDAFPLNEVKHEARPAGSKIFRKRSMEGEEPLVEESEKKPKLETDEKKVVEEEAKEEDLDDLLDEL